VRTPSESKEKEEIEDLRSVNLLCLTSQTKTNGKYNFFVKLEAKHAGAVVGTVMITMIEEPASRPART
jgi:hypothetical protein